MLSNPHRSLTKAAIEVATAVNDDGDHTVGAALMTKTGEIVTGVNASIFSGDRARKLRHWPTMQPPTKMTPWSLSLQLMARLPRFWPRAGSVGRCSLI